MLHLHRAERADRLADALAQVLRVPQRDPFAAEIVSVASRGMERWLTQTLSAQLGSTPGRNDGVCAGVEFPFPRRLIGDAIASAAGIDPDRDPWLPERMVWPLLEVVQDSLEQPWLEPLAAHLGSAPERRFSRVRELASLFDHYSIARPGLLASWARGEGAGWQPELWRGLRERIGVPSGAERLEAACGRLRLEPDLAALPARFALFGITRLPPGYVRALHALAVHRDVHLLLLHPSPELWTRVTRSGALAQAIGSRADDLTARLPQNRILASWGRDARELQLVLAGGREPAADHHHALAGIAPGTLLGALQTAVRDDRSAPGPPLPGDKDLRLELDPSDASVSVHSCHGRRRQVEVVREAILHRLQADPTLEPREVIVMCPDIETFAPLIQAAFGTGQPVDDPALDGTGGLEPGGRVELRVRLADRSLRQTNPVLQVVARLLELAHARLTASEVLDLIDSEPVRRRFGLDDEALSRIRGWVVEAQIHWGLDAEHRGAFKLGDLEAGTWAAGLRRLLAGVALGDSGGTLYRGVLPLDDVDSGSIELAGRFAELLERLRASLRSLHGPHTLTGWAQALNHAADALTAVADRDAWQRIELSRLLTEVVVEAAGGAASTNLALPEVRALLSHRLAGRPTRASFRTGHLTVCTLHPMRSVPHRVVCLLGLDDGSFPRRAPRNGDDLLLADPHVGDRDPRSEDRQLLLDALLAARDALIVTYSGRDERTNAPRPPAVPVGELLDAIDATARVPGGASAREQIVVQHPLQPFDPRNFVPDRLIRDRPWSFDEVELEGARALAETRSRRPAPAPAPFLAAPLPPLDEHGALALQDLIAFVERPVRAFLRQRLGIAMLRDEDEVRDELPVTLDALERWGVGQRLLEGRLAGLAPRDAAIAEIARGALPPGTLGRPALGEVWHEVEALVSAALRHQGSGAASSRETNVVLGDGTRLTGTVSGVSGQVLLAANFSRLSARHRLGAWVRLLALSAAHPDLAFEAVTIGRNRAHDDDPEAEVAVVRIPPLARTAGERRELALAELEKLADMRRRGLREPLPLPVLSADAYASARVRGRSDHEQAARLAAARWTSRYESENEDREPEHVLAFGAHLTFDALLALAPREDERGPGWDEALESRFARYALRLFSPLLARELNPR